MCINLYCRVKERYINYAYAIIDIFKYENEFLFQGQIIENFALFNIILKIFKGDNGKYLMFFNLGSTIRQYSRLNRIIILRT